MKDRQAGLPLAVPGDFLLSDGHTQHHRSVCSATISKCASSVSRKARQCGSSTRAWPPRLTGREVATREQRPPVGRSAALVLGRYNELKQWSIEWPFRCCCSLRGSYRTWTMRNALWLVHRVSGRLSDRVAVVGAVHLAICYRRVSHRKRASTLVHTYTLTAGVLEHRAQDRSPCQRHSQVHTSHRHTAARCSITSAYSHFDCKCAVLRPVCRSMLCSAWQGTERQRRVWGWEAGRRIRWSAVMATGERKSTSVVKADGP